MWKNKAADTVITETQNRDYYLDLCARYHYLIQIKDLTYDELSAAYGTTTILHTGTRIKGSYFGESSLYLLGQIEGESVHSSGTIYIDNAGKILSEIKADNVFTSGEVHGSIETEKVSYFEKTAKINVSDIKTNYCIINEGAQLSGHVTSTSDSSTCNSHEQYHNIMNDFQRVMALNLNILTTNTKVDGDLHCKDNELIILGSVNGNVYAHNRAVILAKNATVLGDIICQDLFIDGNMQGNVQATDSIFLSKIANVEGSLAASRVNMEAGCVFSGKVELSGESSIVNHDNNCQYTDTQIDNHTEAESCEVIEEPPRT